MGEKEAIQMMELCFNQSVSGLLKYWGREGQEILCLGDDLSIGAIAGAADSDTRREQFLRFGVDPWQELPPEWIVEDWKTCCRVWERLRTLPEGEEVRVWLDHTPGTCCGFLAAAKSLAACHAQVTAALLPAWENRPDGTAVVYASWGEVAPEELDRLLEHGCREVPRAMLNALSHRWRQLQAENAPLRAVVNGQLHSVPVDFYDGMLLSRLPEAGQTLRLAELIGWTLAECRPGIGDWWLARRAEALAAQGKFRLDRDPDRFYNSQVSAI